ncbi:MAG: sulfatase-like hydrolase/transferase [Terriglobales bacterium]|jgi:arylsulfatase A-like enzyme/Tfp pilus assembly protein PilF
MRGIRRFLYPVVVALAISSLGIYAFGGNPPEAATPQSGSVEADAAKPAYPNIIVVTLDTTRADRMGFLGSKRGLTPNLDVLAKDSAVFTRAYSQAPLTPTSHSTIFTGTYPQYHQVLIFPIPLAKDLPYLPAILKEHGYTTAAFVGSIAVDPAWGVPGFERGYDTYDAGYNWDKYTPATRYQTVERRGGEVVEHALAWLSKQPQGPFFIWVHLFDPHEPYEPLEPFKTRYAKAPYDGEIAYVDSVMGKFFKQLKASGLYDNTVVALTADHGESLGAHGENEHGIFLYDETIHVPLVIKLPQGAVAGKRIEDRVELADIMPTLLGSIGVPVPEKVQGQSLLGFLKPDTAEGAAAAKMWQDRGAYSQSDYAHLSFAWSAQQSLRTGKYLYIQSPRRELYEDAVDPEAQHNLAAKSPAVADTISANMRAFEEKTTNKQETPKARMDEAKIQKLAVLGYMAARSDSPYAAPGEEGADPKDKIQIANTILRINNMLQDLAQDQRCGKVIPEIKKALVTSPDISLLHFFLAGCYMDMEDFSSAAPELRKAVKLDPGFTRAELNLGRSLMNTEDYEGAATAFEHVLKAEPNIFDAHIFLIVAYAKLDRTQDEIRECQTVLKTLPDNFGANVNLGRALAKTGDFANAVAPLQKAISLAPDRPQPHLDLADVYDKLGKPDDANRERAEAERLGAVRRGAAQTPPGDNQSHPQ